MSGALATRFPAAMRRLAFFAAVMFHSAVAEEPAADPMADADGRELMEAVYARHHQYPYVFEEQSMVLIDRVGNRDTRKLRRYSRVDSNGDARILLLFDSPPEVRGVAVLARRTVAGEISKQIYLPALGGRLVDTGPLDSSDAHYRNDAFLGTDFSIEDLAGENLEDYHYLRRPDVTLEEVPFYVVDVHRSAEDAAPPLRRHYILKDGLFIYRTDHFDELGRLEKRQTHHDLIAVEGDMWRANMILMENLAEDHRSVVKIDRRVFSIDYVPEYLFTADWLFENAPPTESGPEGSPNEPATEPEQTATEDQGTTAP